MLMRPITKVNGNAPMIIALRKAAIGLLSPAASKSVPIRAVKMMPQMIRCLMLVSGSPPDMIVFMIRMAELADLTRKVMIRTTNMLLSAAKRRRTSICSKVTNNLLVLAAAKINQSLW